jgi:1,2-dihydroxy-3-keto-5-methylthiopentene dioxygenase
MTIEAWYMDSSDEDQRLPHKTDPVQPVSLETLALLGVLAWTNIEVLHVL